MSNETHLIYLYIYIVYSIYSLYPRLLPPSGEKSDLRGGGVVIRAIVLCI